MVQKLGVRKLRDGLTRHLGRVRRGARIVITDRGRPIAWLLPFEAEAQDDQAERLNALLSSGHVEPAERQFPPLPPLVAGKGALPSDLIGEGRR